MEDISRELEREIARAKPSPYKTSKKKKILVVDDFGEFRSGGYLKVLVYIFSGASLVGILGAIGFYLLFADANRENKELKKELSVIEKKAEQLTKDKEILMARLVMAGKKPELSTASMVSSPPEKEKQAGIKSKPGSKAELDKEEDSLASDEDAVASVGNEEPVPSQIDDAGQETVVQPVSKEVVSVEKFSVVRGNTREELVVRFNIRNIAKESKEISGRIFAVLKPENSLESEWVVAPKALLESGIPNPYRKGQYFSISRFKPVKFTIRNQASPDSFSKASIYIFGDNGKLLFENTIPINQADQG